MATLPTVRPSSSASQPPTNRCNDVDEHKCGYPKLAFFFSQCSRHLHVRRFSALAVRLLLYRQHRLIDLEQTILDIEAKYASGNDDIEKEMLKNFAFLKPASGAQNVYHQVYAQLKLELKEYEEAILRFDRLARKGYDVAEIRTIQSLLDQNPTSLSGTDATTWGFLDTPESYAFDIIQVVGRPSPSTMGKFLQERMLKWAPRFPPWLWVLTFWSRKQANAFNLYNFNSRRFEAVSLALGNIAASLLIYAAVTSLYFTAGTTSNIAGVVIISVTITACSMLFQNQQFVSMLATVCAVLVTLLLNDVSRHPQPTQTCPHPG